MSSPKYFRKVISALRTRAKTSSLFSLLLAAAILYPFLRPATPSTGDEPGRQRAAQVSAASAKLSEARATEAFGQLPLSFEANLGQTDERVKFLSRGQGYGLFLTADEAVLTLRKNAGQSLHDAKTALPSSSVNVLKMKLAGANTQAQASGSGELPGRNNYFIGNDPQKWRTDVPTYTKIKYEAVYTGIDLVYYGNQRQLEYDFIVSPGAKTEQIRLAFDGASDVRIEANGELTLKLSGGEQVRQHKPFIYQEVNGARREIAGRYVQLDGREIGFEVDRYDVTKPLVIDPVLVYSTYLGGSDYDASYGVAVDAQGNAYITGMTSSLNFPTTAGSVQPVMQPLEGTSTYYGDAFVTKLNAAGSAALYSTFLGGTVAGEIARGIAVDNAGNAYITGVTGGGGVSSAQNDFPTVNAFQSAFGGTDDAFVTKLNANGSALIFSTYLGSVGSELGFRIVVNPATGESYTAGVAGAGFPTTPGAFKTDICPEPNCTNWLPDGFVTKFGPAGGAPLWSTLFGGSGGEYAYDIALDAGGNTYITGTTSSINFPVTGGAFQTGNSGATPQPLSPGTDAFVTKLNPTGSGLVYSTYLGGGPQSDRGFGIEVDQNGNAYVTGQTQSAGFPTTQGAFDVGYNGGEDAFITKFNPEGSALVYSTFLGGTWEDVGSSIAVNPAGEAFIAGRTKAPDFPTRNSLQPKTAAQNFSDVFLTRLNTTGSSLVFSTFLGAGEGRDVVLDQSGNAYLTGEAVMIPTTAGSFQPVKGSPTTDDGFVMKIGPTDETAQTFSIGGTVTDLNPRDPADNTPITMTLSGTVNRVVTIGPNSNTYTFGQLPAGGTYTVTPSKPGFIFAPQSETFTNLGANLTAEFTVLVNEPPTATVTSPVHGDTFNSPGPIPITATASDADGTVTRVEFSAYSSETGNIVISTDTTAPYEASWINVAPGDYNIYATPYDNLGRRGESNFAYIHVLSTTIPVVTLTSPTEGASYQAGSNIPVNATVTSQGQISVVEFYAGTDLIARDVNAPYGFSWTPATPGAFALTAKAFDNGGATGVSSPVNVNITPAAPDIYGMVSWRGEALGGVTMTLSGSQNRTVTTDASGRYRFEDVTPGESYTVTPTHPGYTFYPVNRVYDPMFNYDAYGNFEATQVSPVSAQILSPSYFQQFNAPANITITAQAESSAGPISKVEFYASANAGTTLIGDALTAPYSITWNNVSGGIYQLYVIATDTTGASVYSQTTPIIVNSPSNLVRIHGQVIDGAGFGMPGIRITLSGSRSETAVTNLNGYYMFGNLPLNGNYTVTAPTDYAFEPASYTFNNLTEDVLDRNFVTTSFNQSPTVSLTSPANGAVFGMPINIPVNATASDSDGTITKVIFYRGNSTFNSIAAEDTTAPYGYLWQPNAPGTYNLTAVAVDNAGRRTTSSTVTVTVNAPSPVSLSGRVVDRNSVGIEEVLMTLYSADPEAEPLATTLTDANGGYSFPNLTTFTTYRISASKLSYTFAPAERIFFNLNTAQTADITATLALQRSDFDGDGQTDAAVWRPESGVWYIRRTTDGAYTAQQFGGQSFGDIPVPGNYDGDKKTDIAVFRPSNSTWYVMRSSNNAVTYYQWGISTDKPVAGDYDGDGKTDMAVFRPSTSAWYILRSTDNGVQALQFGASGDMPVAGDYDGDGKTDVAVWRPSNGYWYVQQSSDGSVKSFPWGMSGDMAAGGDYDGDKKMDFAVYRPSNGYWYITLSSDGSTRYQHWGMTGDKPIPGDYDLDGKTDIAVWRPSNGYWYALQSKDNSLLAQPWGTSGDLPVPSAYIP